jgi:hypothetical protein
MRKVLESKNYFAYRRQILLLRVLLEELQVYGNRMEAGLSYTGDLDKLHQKRKTLLKQIEDLKKAVPVDDKKDI